MGMPFAPDLWFFGFGFSFWVLGFYLSLLSYLF
jgi:hypothetical protein